MDKQQMVHIVGEIFGHGQCPENWSDDLDYLVQSLKLKPDDGYNYVTVNELGGISTTLGSRGLTITQRSVGDGYYEFSLPTMEGNYGSQREQFLKKKFKEWGQENSVYLTLLAYMSSQVATWHY